MTTTPVEKPVPSSLGLELSGSASEGHKVALTRNDALETIFGTTDPKQASALLSQCLRVLKSDEAGDGGGANDERHFMLSIVRDLAPRDAVERMLAVQMAATHVAVVRSGQWLAGTKSLPHVHAYSTAYAKLTRTFAAQVEALQKHRRGGKQTVVVQHVTVADGGQAIVGHVETGGRDRGVEE